MGSRSSPRSPSREPPRSWRSDSPRWRRAVAPQSESYEIANRLVWLSLRADLAFALPSAGAERPVSAATLRIEQTLTTAGPQPSVSFRSDDAAVSAPFADPRNGATFFVGNSVVDRSVPARDLRSCRRAGRRSTETVRSTATRIWSRARAACSRPPTPGAASRCWRAARWRAATTRCRRRRPSAWSCASRRSATARRSEATSRRTCPPCSRRITPPRPRAAPMRTPPWRT